jgi:ABC-type polysaccharide/polyol phosphate export permease
MKILTHIDPVTYAVDGLRHVILGISSMPLSADVLIILGFDFVLILAGTWAFNKMKL